MDNYQQMIHLSRYARHVDGENRRETWAETVGRYFQFFTEKVPTGHKKEFKKLQEHVIGLEVMPSMRALMTAGPALDRDNVAGYNCAYMPIDRKRNFDEMMYVLMCGTGQGFSVESKYTSQLPVISEDMYETDTMIVVRDSKIGWAAAYHDLVSLLYDGKVPRWDTSRLRPKGAPLKTFGGRASGPEPLEELFKYTVNTFRRFAGQKLPPIAVHDLCCKIAEIVVVGGVRRSALISLSDVNDTYMQKAKSPYEVKEYTLLGHNEETGMRKYSLIVDDAPYGDRSLIVEVDDWASGEIQSRHQLGWWHVHPERALSNNSASYDREPHFETFLGEMESLYKSHSGERGIFNREAAQIQAARNGRRDAEDQDYGTNPCSEIILLPYEFCNLTEVVVRNGDTLEQLLKKVEVATILGTLQSTLTDFRYLSKKWKDNCENERLLGVSLTGIMDHEILSNRKGDEKKLTEWLTKMRECAIETNKKWADILKINPSAAITCVKPSGTVSQLVDSASGIHPRMAQYYFRTVRGDAKDPVSHFMKQQGIYSEPDVTNNNNDVFYFPIKAPDHAILADEMGAIEQLNLWKIYAEFWCEHKPSQTVYYRDNEYFAVCQWVWENFEWISGISFLPYSDHVYQQAPYIPITEEEYNEAVAKQPEIDWALFIENEDGTLGSQTFACAAGVCELTDLGAN